MAGRHRRHALLGDLCHRAVAAVPATREVVAAGVAPAITKEPMQASARLLCKGACMYACAHTHGLLESEHSMQCYVPWVMHACMCEARACKRMKAHASTCKRMHAHASACKQMQVHASTCKRLQAHACACMYLPGIACSKPRDIRPPGRSGNGYRNQCNRCRRHTSR